MKPLEVKVDGDLEKAIRKLKRMMATEGVLKALKTKRHYEKPSERRKRKHREALRRLRKRRAARF